MRFFFLLCLSLYTLTASSQSAGIPEIEQALNKKHYNAANTILQEKISKYIGLKQPDSLVNYIYYAGKVAADIKDGKSGDIAVEELITKIKALAPGPKTLKQTYIEAGNYFGSVGNSHRGYEYNLIAWKYANAAKSTPTELGLIQNNLSAYAHRLGNIALNQKHSRRAIQLLKSAASPDYALLSDAQSGFGNSLYYQSKIDSAEYYYQAAISSLNKAPKNSINQDFGQAMLLNNMAGIYTQQGKTQKAINALYQVIQKHGRFIQSPDAGKKKNSAITYRFGAMDNLAGIYKELGDLQKAQDLMEYSYQRKKEELSPDDPEIYYSQILLGRLYYALHDDDKAISFLNQGITNYEQNESKQNLWVADGYSTLALIYDYKKQDELATKYYNKADSLYESSLQGSYDFIYLSFLRNKSQFFAERGKVEMARQVANKTYQYIVKAQGKESIAVFYELLNLSKVEYIAGNYSGALAHAEDGLELINKKILTAGSLIDSIKLELKKPLAILYQSKAAYQLPGGHDRLQTKAILKELDHALDIIERKKSFISDPENNRILLSENKELFEFVKQLNLALYKLAGKKSYIDRIMSLQESALYSRIRSRLNRNDSMRFAYVPQHILNQEKLLNQSMKESLRGTKNHDHAIANYVSAVNNIKTFREGLKKDYPSYYKMRYESIISSLGNIEKSIQPGNTLVRYFYVDTTLYALIADESFREIIPLSTNELSNNIRQLNDPTSGKKEVSTALFHLYNILWKPLEKHIKHQKIIVIPDGILFNLNFEILTPQQIKNYRDLATKSLLAKYTFSYQYSLFLLNQPRQPAPSAPLFSGYAPGFSRKLKDTYRETVKDSFLIDREYMNLLPQPFTISLMGKLKALLRGHSYLGADCTREQFVNNAGNHLIIHVGTHAVSNNLYPEYSKLIFAKSASSTSGNELYADDIYGYDLRSDLTVLSACETGRPGFKDGEGMISLANAFNYSGSKSLLTGLWKIDEKSSAILLESFYEYLKKGMAKDEALRQAKLDYLGEQQGRMLAPEYWAGLVLIGDTAPIEMPKENNFKWLWILTAAVLLVGGVVYFRKKIM